MTEAINKKLSQQSALVNAVKRRSTEQEEQEWGVRPWVNTAWGNVFLVRKGIVYKLSFKRDLSEQEVRGRKL